MKVRMLADTNYQGFKAVGKEYDVPEIIAQRWVNNGIAEIAEKVVININDLSSKELYKLCVEQGLEVEPKKSKEYYLELLEAEKEEVEEITE